MAGSDDRFSFHVRQSDYFKPGRPRVYAERFPHSIDAAMHDHDLFEIALVVTGRCVHVSAEGERSLGTGDVVLLRPGAWHALTKPSSFIVFNCLFAPELLSGPLAWALEDESLHLLMNVAPVQENRRGVLVMRLSPESVARCVNLMDRISTVNAASPLPEYAAVGVLLQLLGELAGGLTEHAKHEPVDTRRTVHPAIHKIIRLLTADARRHWTIHDLAGLVGLTGPYLVRRFTADVGMPPLRYLGRLRAETAAASLLRTDKPITEIGLDVGWPESHHFARRFKEHFGLTATEYRRRFRTAVR